MIKYHKIESLFKRDLKTGKFLIGEWSRPEFKLLCNIGWEFTEKVDGTNIRIHWDGQKMTIGGRNENSQIPCHLLTYLTDNINSEMLRSQFGETPATLIGEGFGHKIQKVGHLYKGEEVGLCLFDISIGHWWLKRNDVDEIAKALNLESTPVVHTASLIHALHMCQEGFKSAWGDFTAEGLVMRPVLELKDRAGRRIISKLKCSDFRIL